MRMSLSSSGAVFRSLIFLNIACRWLKVLKLNLIGLLSAADVFPSFIKRICALSMVKPVPRNVNNLLINALASLSELVGGSL